jgi:threonine dehydrogenase-like Zn-dependent dehydrogenase
MDKVNKKLIFNAPYMVQVKNEKLSPPLKDQVLVQTEISAISPGTEMLFYRGQVPEGLRLDEIIPALNSPALYPTQYGYAIVGKVIEVGDKSFENWLGKRVFSFSPHQRFSNISPQQLLCIPDDISDEDAVFFPNMETAVNLVQDANPIIGEQVAVTGAGIVGLMTMALLQQFPLDRLVALEKIIKRQEYVKELGLEEVYFPELFLAEILIQREKSNSQFGVDLVLECSGSPSGLQLAIDIAGFDGRIVVGSWFGNKQITLDLGARFHRQRLQLISSQVSTISPKLMARWEKQRRSSLVWKMIKRIKPSRWITRSYPIEEAASVYGIIDKNPEKNMQIVFEYST